MSVIPSRADEITAVLRTEILTGQYRPGERLPSERELAARFNSNRGAIREVIKKLEQLGIVVVNPGGVRIQPVEDATLDVLGYLLDLDEVDRPQLLGQTMEVMGAMVALSARSAIDLSDARERHHLQDLIEEMIASEGDPESHQQCWQAFTDALTAIHGNLVLRLVGNGLRTQFLATTIGPDVQVEIDHERFRTALHALLNAVTAADADLCAEAVRQYFAAVKQHVMLIAQTATENRRTSHG